MTVVHSSDYYENLSKTDPKAFIAVLYDTEINQGHLAVALEHAGNLPYCEPTAAILCHLLRYGKRPFVREAAVYAIEHFLYNERLMDALQETIADMNEHQGVRDAAEEAIENYLEDLTTIFDGEKET